MNRAWAGIVSRVVLVGGMLGCARTSMVSRTPRAVAHPAFHRVLVVALLDDAALRRVMERRVASHGVAGHYLFVAAADVFAAGVPRTRDDSAAALRAQGIDATLYIIPEAAGADSGWTPPTTQQICAVADPQTGCTFISVVTGGSPYRRPWKQFAAALVDARTRSVVWLADATTDGSDDADDGVLVRSMADRTVRQLADDGVLR